MPLLVRSLHHTNSFIILFRCHLNKFNNCLILIIITISRFFFSWFVFTDTALIFFLFLVLLLFLFRWFLVYIICSWFVITAIALLVFLFFVLFLLLFKWLLAYFLNSFNCCFLIFYLENNNFVIRKFNIKMFPRQSLKRFSFTFCVKSSDSIFFLFGLSRGKYFLIHLEIAKRPKKWNYTVEILFKTR